MLSKEEELQNLFNTVQNSVTKLNQLFKDKTGEGVSLTTVKWDETKRLECFQEVINNFGKVSTAMKKRGVLKDGDYLGFVYDRIKATVNSVRFDNDEAAEKVRSSFEKLFNRAMKQHIEALTNIAEKSEDNKHETVHAEKSEDYENQDMQTKKIKGHKNKDMHSKWRPIFEKYFGKVSKYFEKGIVAEKWKDFKKDIGLILKMRCTRWFNFMDKMCGSSTAIKNNEAKTPNTMLAILLASCCATNDLSKAKAICGGLKKITKNSTRFSKNGNLNLEEAENVRESIKKALRSESQIGKNLWNAIKNNENFKSLIPNDTNVSNAIEAAVQQALK